MCANPVYYSIAINTSELIIWLKIISQFKLKENNLKMWMKSEKKNCGVKFIEND